MERGRTLSKALTAEDYLWVDPRLYHFSSTQGSAPAVIEKQKVERRKLEP
jgi:hypothetical protein